MLRSSCNCYLDSRTHCRKNDIVTTNQGSTGCPELPAVVTAILRMQADHILLLDSFFYLVIFHGTTVASWRKNEYHLQPEHAAFAELLTVSTRMPPCLRMLLGSAQALVTTLVVACFDLWVVALAAYKPFGSLSRPHLLRIPQNLL